MQLQLDGYAIQTVMQALQESDRLWDERIAEAEAGERPNFSIEGAKMMKDDLRLAMAQIRQSGQL